ncbi:MAG: hypothetical protein IIX79_05230 [Alistipes sp.]|nr:hypothetical protein [Alistipes sp.]
MTINYLGKYDNLSLLWEAHPNGGIEGEYCYVGDQLLVWDKYENDWVEGSAEVLDVIPSEQPERESNNGLNCIGYFESEQQLWSQHPQGGVEGDYVVIAGKEYIWDKYNKEWREATEEDAAHFAAVIVQDEAYEYSRLAITFMGSFENVSQIWKVYPQGGIEGGYIYLGEDKYIWDKYSYSWKPFEPTESSKLRPIDVTYTEGVVAYSEDYINYIGTFDNLDQVWEMYPNGGKDGDYILVNGERLKWNKYTSNWGEDESGDTSPARSVATIYGDLHIFNDLVIGEDLYARILEELSKKQWVQDNFTTKQWLLEQNYARQEWVLGQYEVLQDWVDQRNADIAKWILERNYISEGDISSETVMNLIETDEITITKKDGVLAAIALEGQGFVPIITTEDIDAIPSDQNVFSAAKVAATFLDATKGGAVLEPVNFEKGIRIGGEEGIEIIYDIENNALCFGGNVYSLGGVTAGKIGDSSSGGGDSYIRLDTWTSYNENKAGYVLSAGLGYDLHTRISALEAGGGSSAVIDYNTIVSALGYVPYDASNPYGYVTEDFIVSQGYVSQEWVEKQGYIKFLDSVMVVNALGYTPYNAANFTKAKIKSTLGISNWALESTKPEYTAGEVGALGALSQAIDSAKLGGQFPSYFATASALSTLTKDFAVEQGYIDTLQSYFSNGSANNALKLGGQQPSYYASASALTTLTNSFNELKALFDKFFEWDEEYDAIKAKISLYSLGGITAGGMSLAQTTALEQRITDLETQLGLRISNLENQLEQLIPE